jgi:hypothetical protein
VEYELRFPAPAAVKSLNQLSKGTSWGARKVESDWKRQWRDAASVVARIHYRDLEPFKGQPVEVTVALPFKDNRRRDPSNYIATTKGILDGLTDSGCLWPDDNSDWVRQGEPVLWRGPDVVVRIRLRDPSLDWVPTP